jgi:hypothetical protein
MRTRSPNRAAQEHPAAPLHPTSPTSLENSDSTTPPRPVPAPSATSPPAREQRLQALLRDLGSDLRQGPGLSPMGREARQLCPTGRPLIDDLLGGGLPCGRLSEVAGPASSGRTSLALSLLSEATRAGHCVGWIDLANAFDPASAEDAQVVLERVLWVRPRHLADAFRCTERLLATEGFPLVVLDVAVPQFHQAQQQARLRQPRSPNAPNERERGRRLRSSGSAARSNRDLDPNAWLRLSRITAGTQSALAVLTEERRAGSSAHISLELRPGLTRWSEGHVLLEGLESEVVLARHRAAPAGRSVRLHSGDRDERAA